MDSFYGGKQGISFIIKDRFDSIDEMNYCFGHGYYPLKNNNSDISQWTNDTTRPYDNIRYDEYCLIQTQNRNNPDNGKVFRRTAYRVPVDADDTNYAEYVGRITGPAGGVPFVELNSISDMRTAAMGKIEEGSVFYYQKKTGDTVSYTFATPTQGTDIYVNTDESVNSIYKPGSKYFEEEETPAFKYGFYTFQSVRNIEANSEWPLSTLGIGFEIPYIDFAQPKITSIGNTETAEVIRVPIDNDNPFYLQDQFKIPVGDSGPYITNEGIYEVTDGNVFYDIETIQYTPGGETPYIRGDVVENLKSSKVYAGKFHYWGINSDDQKVLVTPEDLYYLGDVVEIENVSVKSNYNKGTYDLYVQYSNAPDEEKYIGPVGPPSLGPWTVKLEGEWDENDNIRITTDPVYPDQEGKFTGNLGIIAVTDIKKREGQEDIPEGFKETQGLFYICLPDEDILNLYIIINEGIENYTELYGEDGTPENPSINSLVSIKNNLENIINNDQSTTEDKAAAELDLYGEDGTSENPSEDSILYQYNNKIEIINNTKSQFDIETIDDINTFINIQKKIEEDTNVENNFWVQIGQTIYDSVYLNTNMIYFEDSDKKDIEFNRSINPVFFTGLAAADPTKAEIEQFGDRPWK